MRGVLFRCDASAELGAGHVMRCLALAETLEWAGWVPVFATNADAPKIVSALRSSGYPIVTADPTRDWSKLDDYDIAAVVFDHYGCDAVDERWLARGGRATVVIDDLADRAHDCDVLIDSTPGRLADSYKMHVPERCHLLVGSENAIVRRAWHRQRAASRKRLQRGGRVQNIVVSMGSTDPNDATSRILAAIDFSGYRGTVDVILGAGAPHIGKVAAVAKSPVKLHVEPPDIAALVASADLAIGAPGSSSFDRALLGLPSLIVCTAENQRFLAAAFADNCAAELVPSDLLDSPGALGERIRVLTEDESRRLRMSRAAANVTDGRGALRVLAALGGSQELRAGRARLRLSDVGDEDWLLGLQHQPSTRRFARNPEPPSVGEHRAWFLATLDSVDRLLMIVLVDDQRAGMVRLDKSDDKTFEVSIAIHESWQSSGVGTAALRMLRRMTPGADLTAHILEENIASGAVFAAAGYTQVGLNHYWNKAKL